MPEPTDIPKVLRQWQERARSVAQGHTHHATKRAVDEVRMSEDERGAAHQMYRAHEETITTICRHVYRKAQRSPQAPPVSEEDVVQASWELFLRCLVHYDPEQGSLDTYLGHALRARVTDYLRSLSHPRTDPPARDPSSPSGAPTSDLVDMARAMVEEGRLSDGEHVKGTWRWVMYGHPSFFHDPSERHA